MQENTTLFRLWLSGTGGIITGLLGLIVGLAWGAATAAGGFLPALLIGAFGFIWGAITVQLTPTGGVIAENRTTVNYALLVTYVWMAAFACIAAGVVFLLRTAF